MHSESSSTLAHASLLLINFDVCIFILVNCHHEYNRFQWVLLENYHNWGWCWRPSNLLCTVVLCTGLFWNKSPCLAHYSKPTSWGNLQHSAVGPNCALVKTLSQYEEGQSKHWFPHYLIKCIILAKHLQLIYNLLCTLLPNCNLALLPEV